MIEYTSYPVLQVGTIVIVSPAPNSVLAEVIAPEILLDAVIEPDAESETVRVTV